MDRILMTGKDLRQDGYYKDFVRVSMGETQRHHGHAEKLTKEIEKGLR